MANRPIQPWFSDEELHREIRVQNPWWENGSIPDGLLRPFHRNAFYEALEFVDNGSNQRAVVLLGASGRQNLNGASACQSRAPKGNRPA